MFDLKRKHFQSQDPQRLTPLRLSKQIESRGQSQKIQSSTTRCRDQSPLAARSPNSSYAQPKSQISRAQSRAFGKRSGYTASQRRNRTSASNFLREKQRTGLLKEQQRQIGRKPGDPSRDFEDSRDSKMHEASDLAENADIASGLHRVNGARGSKKDLKDYIKRRMLCRLMHTKRGPLWNEWHKLDSKRIKLLVNKFVLEKDHQAMRYILKNQHKENQLKNQREADLRLKVEEIKRFKARQKKRKRNKLQIINQKNQISVMKYLSQTGVKRVREIPDPEDLEALRKTVETQLSDFPQRDSTKIPQVKENATATRETYEPSKTQIKNPRDSEAPQAAEASFPRNPHPHQIKKDLLSSQREIALPPRQHYSHYRKPKKNRSHKLNKSTEIEVKQQIYEKSLRDRPKRTLGERGIRDLRHAGSELKMQLEGEYVTEKKSKVPSQFSERDKVKIGQRSLFQRLSKINGRSRDKFEQFEKSQKGNQLLYFCWRIRALEFSFIC